MGERETPGEHTTFRLWTSFLCVLRYNYLRGKLLNPANNGTMMSIYEAKAFKEQLHAVRNLFYTVLPENVDSFLSFYMEESMTSYGMIGGEIKTEWENLLPQFKKPNI